MASFGELVLVLGDMHIPSRASKIPAPFKRMLVPGRMQHVICTGNSPTDELQSLAPNLHFVSGDWDTESDSITTYPETRVLQVGPFRIGVVHGHQIVPWKSHEALSATRRRLNVDVLITGHTHQNSVVVEEDGCYINPVRHVSVCWTNQSTCVRARACVFSIRLFSPLLLLLPHEPTT